MDKETSITQDTSNIILFNDEKIRRVWHNDERYFSVVDVVSILTQSQQPSRYWTDLKNRMSKYEGFSELFAKCEKLKFTWLDWKNRPWDWANTKTILRIIQSVPSPKAEPFKQRLASLGNDRVDEVNDPELWIARARARAIAIYKSKWMTDDDIQRRISSIETRNSHTDEYQSRWIVWIEYWILTNLWYWIFGTDAEWIKKKKWLNKSDNPRDHMNKTELLLTELTEETSKNLIKKHDAKWFNEIAPCVSKSVDILKDTKDSIESATWESVLSEFNRITPRQKELRNKEHRQKLSK
mgnify:CR=1 FL=1